MNEFETVIALSRYDRINNGHFSIWTNDSVVIKHLASLGAEPYKEFNYKLSLEDFIFLPKRKNKKKNPQQLYPDFLVMPNDNHNKETLVTFTQTQRRNKIMHIFTEDDHFLTRCKKYNLVYKNNVFISNDDFRAYGKRAKLNLSDEELAERRIRMQMARDAR